MKWISQILGPAIVVIMLTACATPEPVRLTLNTDSGDLSESDYGSIPTSAPERSHNALLTNFREDSEQSLINTIRHANAVLDSWPEHRYAPSSAYLAGWASLWVDAQPAAHRAMKDFAAWRAYIGALITASSYFERAGAYDAGADSFWTTSSSEPLALIHEGFVEPMALARFLGVQRVLKIGYLETPDFDTLQRAILALEEIEKEYPTWSRNHGLGTSIRRLVAAATVEEDRRRRADEIFGGKDG